MMDDKEDMGHGMVILGGSKKGEMPEMESEEDEGDMSEEQFQKAIDVKSALESGDDEDFALALMNFIKVCG